MVELQSSKLCVWVRFLLFLKIVVLKTLNSQIKLTSTKYKKSQSPLNNRTRCFKQRFLNVHLLPSSSTKAFTPILNVWDNGVSFLTHRTTQKNAHTVSDLTYSNVYPMFHKIALFFRQQYTLNLTYNQPNLVTLLNYAKVNTLYGGALLNFTTQNTSTLISKFFNVHTADNKNSNFPAFNNVSSSLLVSNNHTVNKLNSTDPLGYSLNRTSTLLRLKQSIFSLCQFNKFITKTTQQGVTFARQPSYKFKKFYRFKQVNPSIFTYSLHMLTRFKSNTFRFKSQASAYEFYRYKFRFVRIFKGTGWNAFKPGYHQSYYGALRYNHNTTGPVVSKPTAALNVFYFQRYLYNDLLAESVFSSSYTQITAEAAVNQYGTAEGLTNWRSSSSLNQYLTSLIQSLYQTTSTGVKLKQSEFVKPSIKFPQLRNIHKRKAFTRSPYRIFSQTPYAQANARHKLLSVVSLLTKSLSATTLLGHHYLSLDAKPMTWINTPSKSLSRKTHNNFTNLVNFNPLLMKTALTYNFFFKYVTTKSLFQRKALAQTSLLEVNQLFHPYSTPSNYVNNISSSSAFVHELQRRLVKSFESSRWSAKVSPWYLNTLVRFMEHCSGKKVLLKLNPFIENSLTFTDLAKCSMWLTRVAGFQKLLGPKFFLDEVLKAVTLALKVKDATFFSNWIRGMLKRLSFWKIRVFFRFLKYMMRYVFWTSFDYFQFKGLKICLKGKISVAGNARKRTLLYRIGTTSYSKFDNKISYDFSCIGSFTGVMGFRVWMFF